MFSQVLEKTARVFIKKITELAKLNTVTLSMWLYYNSGLNNKPSLVVSRSPRQPLIRNIYKLLIY